MTHKERLAHIREEHHKACKLHALTIAVIGLFVITFLGHEYLGLAIHVFGLYVMELI